MKEREKKELERMKMRVSIFQFPVREVVLMHCEDAVRKKHKTF